MERFDLELPALLSMLNESGKHQAAEFIISNICAGGAFFKTDRPLPINTDVKMDLILPLQSFTDTIGKRSHVDVSGTVIRTDDQGMAVCFDNKYRINPY